MTADEVAVCRGKWGSVHMTGSNSGPASRYLIPPVHFGLALALVVAARFALPVWSTARVASFGVGATLLAAGLALGVGAQLAFRAQSAELSPDATPSVLIRSGVFRVSRNPMYLGMALITAAVALLLGQPLAMVFALALVWVWNSLFIPHEERVLEDAFGSQYTGYKAAVRRWI